MSGSYAPANLGRRAGYAAPKSRENVTRERPASFRQVEAVRGPASTPRTRKVPAQMPVSAANLQQIEEAAKAGLGRRTSLPSRAKTAQARTDAAAACRGRKVSPGKTLAKEAASGPADMGKHLLGLDFALLAQRAAPSSKNRLEQILQQLSDEISKIASQFDDGARPSEYASPIQQLTTSQSEGEGSADTASAATTVLMHQNMNQSIETRIVERLCDKVAGMHSALQYRDSQPCREDPELEDAASLQKVDAHRLSQLENLISALQAKVETLPRYEVDTQSVRNDRLRVETTELQQQKDALKAEVQSLRVAAC